jgi:hypothetical protein
MAVRRFTCGKASMLNFNINLTSLAVILWSGMLIISGSVWVLCSQVRRLGEILEERAKEPAPAVTYGGSVPRVPRRGAAVRLRSSVRGAIAGSTGQAQLPSPRRGGLAVSRSKAADRGNS